VNSGAPVVTIVVTGADGQPNDRLTRSVSSARRQSVRSIEVVVSDAADAVDRAAGDYLLFVEPGIELDVHAARAMLAAAIDTNVELVAGRWELARGPQDPAVQAMFSRTAYYESVGDRPDLREDHALSNKLFAAALLRRTGLRPTPGRLADFTTSAYSAASGIAVIPQRLYVDHRGTAAPQHSEVWVDALEPAGSRLVIRGSLAEPRFTEARAAELALVIAPAGTDREHTVPVTVTEQTSTLLRWESTVDLSTVIRPTWRGYRSWGLRLGLTSHDGQRLMRPLSAQATPDAGDRPLLRRRRWLPVGTVLRAHVNARGNLMLQLAPAGPVGAQVARVSQLPAAAGRVRRSGVRLISSPETKARVYRHLLTKLPLQQRLVLFESHMGQALSDNPRYVFEELQRRDAGFDLVWSFAGAPPPLPAGVRSVRRNSWAYFLTLARAKYWVDNQGFPAAITKPPRTTYLQTWHGSALKHMGEDTPAFRRMSAARQDRHRAMVARWDYFVTRTEHDVRALVPALHVQAEILRTGYPRNDPLVQLHSPEQRAAVRAELGLPADRTLVLYAPTFRETYSGGRQEFELRVDLDHLLDKLPGHLLLVRTHYLQRLGKSVTSHPSARDVSSVPDITPLLVAADILVTDYSSVMFDFANTGRPMVFFTYDYDDYANSERGVYFELQDKAPGPMVATGDELIQALATVDAWRRDYEQRYREFVAEFGEYDTGTAARQVVDHVFFGAARGN